MRLNFPVFRKCIIKKKFPPEFEIVPNPDLINTPVYIHPKGLKRIPAPGKPLKGDDFELFVKRVSEEIAKALKLENTK